MSCTGMALASTPASTIYLASNRGRDTSHAACQARHGCGPTVTAPMRLSNGQAYSIRVSGTVSAWGYWATRSCGVPETRPEFPTSDAPSPTGDDAVFRFASHTASRDCRHLPYRSGLFQINLGHGWFVPTALGNPTKPSGNRGADQHPYTFRVLGQGSRPRFRFVDWHPSDNDGEFKIVISAEPQR